MTNGRCRMHGGKSTGPRTAEGLQRSKRANLKHGRYTREAKIANAETRAAVALVRRLCRGNGPLSDAMRDELADLLASGRL